jgi:rRNA maturation RNase YbeY
VVSAEKPAGDTASLVDLVRLIWQSERRNSCEIRIVLTDDSSMVELNQKYLQKDSLTDVLAFPFEDTDDFFEGEIYINLDQVNRNACVYNVLPGEELRRMVAHGTLHFVGYSDKTPPEKQHMTTLEDNYLAKLKSMMH